MTSEIYFATPHTTAQKQYEALRRYFVDGLTAREVAEEFGYTYRGFTTIVSEFSSEKNSEKIQIKILFSMKSLREENHRNR